jgi:flagellar biosynthesis anti-sigma factor FlgM
MKIEGINPAAVQLPVDNLAARVSNGGPASTQAAAQDWTSFHSDSSSVQALTSQALNSPEVRQGTVDALRQTVSSGQYQLDPAKIAAAITSGNGE